MPRHLLYIINPISGTKTKKDLQRFIEEKTTRQKIPYKIFPSVANGDYSFLIPLIKTEKITDVIIVGGDGTVSQVVGSLMDCDVNFGIIPSGSGNGLAFAAKISKHPSKALETIFNGKAEAIDGFYINDRFACMLCGLGFDARVAHDFADQPKRGLTTYIRLSLKNFFLMKPQHFQLEVQNTTIDTDAYFISVANSNQFGNNFTIAPEASLSDGLLDVVILTSKNKISFVLQTLQQLAGWNKLQATSMIKEKKGILYFQTDQLTIRNLSQAPIHIDGEPAETVDALKIVIRKKCFHLLQPDLFILYKQPW